MNAILGSKPRRLTAALGILTCAIAALIAFAASSTDKATFKITDLFTKEEKKNAGPSKLTDQELEALNAAALRAFVAVSTRASTSSATRSAPRLGGRDDDVDLYDSAGKAAAYIAADQDLTIYLWSGKPCAYLDDEDIYGFNGKHLGWFRSGLVYDHEGYVVAALAEAFRTPVELAPLKSLKQLRPLKGLKELKPMKPLWSKEWSRTPGKVFFLRGAD